MSQLHKLNCVQKVILIVFIIYLSCAYHYYDLSDNQLVQHEPSPQSKHGKIWASMGLCYSHNTNLHGKQRYPYKDVAPLSLLLWKYHLPEVSTIVRIVYTEPKLSQFMKVYGEMLERTGAVVEWVPAGGMDCVLKSQLVRWTNIFINVDSYWFIYRMFASDNKHVDDNDIVVTVDINLFVMTRDILKFLYQDPDMVAWVPQYHDTADISTGNGETFNQNLIAMRAGMWRRMTGYDGNLDNLVKHFR